MGLNRTNLDTGLVPPGASGGDDFWLDARDYGAEGDGVADDAAALNALVAASVANGGQPGYVPRGTYNVSEPIVGLEGSHIIFDIEALLVPTADVNVIEVVRGSRWDRPHIDCSSFSGYTAAAIYVDGITVPINIGQDKAQVVEPWINGNQEGDAILIDASTGVNTTPKVEWLHIERPRVRRMERALVLEGAPFDYVLGGRYVHTVTITAPQLSGCLSYIEILGKSGGHHITDISIQCAADTESILLCEGGGNLITGRIWDVQLANVDQPVVFTPECQSNICILPSFPGYRVKDQGEANIIITSDYSKVPHALLCMPGTDARDGGYGDQDDALAWADIDYTVTQTSGDSTSSGTFDTRKKFLFNLSRGSDFVSWSASATAQVIEIAFGGAVTNWRALALYFGPNNPAEEITIEADLDGAGNWVTLFQTTSNISKVVTTAFAHVDATTCHKLRITLKNENGNIQLDRIWGYRNNAKGKAWLSARDPVTTGFTIGASGSPITQDRKHTPASWNPGSIAAGATLSATRSTNGVALGDVVIGFSSNIALNGIKMFVEISATDEFTVTLWNTTAAPIDLDAISLTIWVRKG